MYVIIGLSCAVALLVLWFFKVTFSFWKDRGLPYLEPTIPWGNAGKMALGEVNFGLVFSEMYHEIRRKGWKHGGAYFFWRPVYIPTDPEIIKDIVVVNFNKFRNHGFYLTKNDVLTNHMFNVEDSRWRDIRSKLSHCFTSGRFRKYFSVMSGCAESLNNAIGARVDAKEIVDIKDLLGRFTTDNVAGFTMGIEANTLRGENPGIFKHNIMFFDKTWCKLNNTITCLFPRQFLKNLKFRITPKESEVFWVDLFNRIKEYRLSSGEKRNDIFETIMNLSDEKYTSNVNDYTGKPSMKPLSFEEAIAHTYVFIVAGFETSSSTISFALYELAKNPDMQTRLRREMNEVMERHNWEVSHDALQEIEFLEMILKETLRMYPSLPLVPRACNEDYKVPGTDQVVPQGTPIFIPNFALHRDPRFWPKPDKFDPERFNSANIHKVVPYTYMPFGEGPRICVAHRFGQLQAKMGIFTVIKNYQVTVNKKMIEPLKLSNLGLNLRPEGGMWLDFQRIK